MKKFCFLLVAMMLVTCIGTRNVNAGTYTVQASIEDDAADTPLEDTADFGTYWEPKCGVPDSSYGKIAADDGGKYIDLKGIYSFISYDEITSPSEFKIALRAKEISPNIGISFRAGSVFNLYEWDFHMEKAARTGTRLWVRPESYYLRSKAGCGSPLKHRTTIVPGEFLPYTMTLWWRELITRNSYQFASRTTVKLQKFM